MKIYRLKDICKDIIALYLIFKYKEILYYNK